MIERILFNCQPDGICDIEEDALAAEFGTQCAEHPLFESAEVELVFRSGYTRLLEIELEEGDTSRVNFREVEEELKNILGRAFERCCESAH